MLRFMNQKPKLPLGGNISIFKSTASYAARDLKTYSAMKWPWSSKVCVFFFPYFLCGNSPQKLFKVRQKGPWAKTMRRASAFQSRKNFQTWKKKFPWARHLRQHRPLYVWFFLTVRWRQRWRIRRDTLKQPAFWWRAYENHWRFPFIRPATKPFMNRGKDRLRSHKNLKKRGEGGWETGHLKQQKPQNPLATDTTRVCQILSETIHVWYIYLHLT